MAAQDPTLQHTFDTRRLTHTYTHTNKRIRTQTNTKTQTKCDEHTPQDKRTLAQKKTCNTQDKCTQLNKAHTHAHTHAAGGGCIVRQTDSTRLVPPPHLVSHSPQDPGYAPRTTDESSLPEATTEQSLPEYLGDGMTPHGRERARARAR